jgi:hypothetical protein
MLLLKVDRKVFDQVPIPGGLNEAVRAARKFNMSTAHLKLNPSLVNAWR